MTPSGDWAAEPTYLVNAANVQVIGLPSNVTFKTIKEIAKMYGGTCQMAMPDGGYHTPNSFGIYFYYKKQTQAQYAIQNLNGQRLRGSE